MTTPVIKNLLTTSKLTIAYVPPSSLKPDSKNPRLHTKRHTRQIGASILAFGFITPLIVDTEGNIICGHGRWAAAIELGLDEVPTVCATHLTEAQVKAFRIADNRLSEASVWDDRLLAENLKELVAVELSFDLPDIGFTMDEIDLRIRSLDIAQQDGPDADDRLPDAVDGPAVSKVGDLWLLGENRVLHGDATKLADIEKLMGGKRAAMTFCDPPYGVDYANSAKDKLRGTHRPILNDNLGEEFEGFLQAACANILSVTDGGVYICMSSSALHTLQGAFLKAGGHWSTFIIWAKQTFTLGRADYQRQFETILYGWREGTERYWCGARDQGDVWHINKPVKNDLHPTMKPVELVMRALRNSSRRGDIVLDTFLGSGSTLIAAERAGRFCYGVELDRRYVDATIRRWQSHTGDQAVDAETGKTFNEVATEASHDA